MRVMTTSQYVNIALIQSSTLSDAVLQEIERSILAGDFPPSGKLNEVELAQKLGVSRGPVREACRMLDEGGRVRTEKNRGVFVRDISIDEAVEIYAIRASLEEMVGRHLALHVTASQLKELKGQLDAMKLVVQEKNADKYHELNLQFHDRMVEMTGNRKLLLMYRKLIKELTLFRRINLSGESALPSSADSHRQIVKAIASGDPEKAGQVLSEHVTHSMQRAVAFQQAPSVKPGVGASSVRKADKLAAAKS